MVHVLFWIIFGGLVGLVGAILKGDTRLTVRSYVLALIGSLGGLLGGGTGLLFTPDLTTYDSQAGGLVFAVLGAIVLVFIAPIIYEKCIAPLHTLVGHTIDSNDRKQSSTRGAKHQSD